MNRVDPTGLYWDVQEFNDDDNWAIWKMILRLDALPGPEGDRFRDIANSPFRVVFIPIQSDAAGQQRWSVPAGDRKDHLNQTTPQNPIDNENGQGIGSRIEFDPNNKLDPAGNPRDPIDAAAHEAGSHAWHNLKGTHSPDHNVGVPENFRFESTRRSKR